MSERKVKAVILAAGKGTRMKSSTPKVLHKIFDKTLIDYVLEAVEKTDYVDEFFVIVGHQAQMVEQHVCKNRKNAKCILQSPQHGTGDAVYKAYDLLSGFDSEVLILCADTPLITAKTLKEFLDFHKKNNSDLTVMSAHFENPTNYGRIVTDENNSIKKIVEEKDADENTKKIKQINAGIYCVNWEKISPAFCELKSDNSQGEYYLTDIIAWAVEKSLKVMTCQIENSDEIFGINSQLNLSEAAKILNQANINNLLDKGVSIVDPQSVFISPETTIEPETVIYPNVYITGCNKIGANCTIGPFSHIRGNVVVGNNVRIGNFVEIKNSTIRDNTNISHLSYIGDSELGSGVNIGAGTITANYNPITKEKNGTVLEDGANTGSNSVLVAPVTVGEMASVAAGSVITKNVPPYSLAIGRSPLKFIDNWVKNKLNQNTKK